MIARAGLVRLLIAPALVAAVPALARAQLWQDATDATIGASAGWSNKVELADLNGDGWVDIVFANGGDYHEPGSPEANQILLDHGPGQPFTDASQVLGPTGDLARVIKVGDVNGDGLPDLIVGTTYQTQSRLYLGDGSGGFTEVTSSYLPARPASIGDLELGDVDGDGDLDMVLADWGPGDPCSPGALGCGDQGSPPHGRVLLWLNDGTGHFADATDQRMPLTALGWSWDLELVDVDNDFDLDVVASCKTCEGGLLFENQGDGVFTDASQRLPRFSNNYDFEPIDIDGDGFLDLVTINDGDQASDDVFDKREHLFLNDRLGGFTDATAERWPEAANTGADDNALVVLDADSDGDPDFLIGSLSGADRLLINDGGTLSLRDDVFGGAETPATLGIAVADLDRDGRLDVVQAQGESAFDNHVYLGTGIAPDTAPPVIQMADRPQLRGATLLLRARIHDNKTPVMPDDFAEPPRATIDMAGGDPVEVPMAWVGGTLWRAQVPLAAYAQPTDYRICATDRAGNRACTDSIAIGGDLAGDDPGAASPGGGCSLAGPGARPGRPAGTGSGSGLLAALALLAGLLLRLVQQQQARSRRRRPLG